MSRRGELHLWAAQRVSAMVLALCVVVHLVTIVYAVRNGLTAAEILGRTRASPGWFAFYTAFVVSVAIHAPIGLRTVLAEVLGSRSRGIDLAAFAFGVVLLAMGMRAVWGRVRMKNDFRARNHPAYWAFIVHRVSGLLLAAFLPLHFWALGHALGGEARLEGFLRWTDHPLVKLSEAGLVILLAAHMAGGVRLLMLEFLAWRDWQKSLLAVAAGVTAAVGLAFLLNLG